MESINFINHFFTSLDDDVSANNLYVVIGDHQLPTNTAYSDNSYRDTKRNAVFGKKVTSTEVAPLIKRNTWSSNTVYDRYDQERDSNYYVINQYRDVYKCVYNSANTGSTIEPTTKVNEMIETSDGYVWKYMYTLTEANLNRFGTNDWMPVIANTDVVANAVSGTIDYVDVTDPGSNFSLYNTGTIQQKLSTLVYKIEDDASIVTNAYQNFNIYIVNGTGAGTLKKISTSYSNSTGKYITFSNATSFNIDSEYIISPNVSVTDRRGSGFQAYMTVTANETIDDIIVIDPGSGYMNPELSLITNGTGSNVSVTFLVAPETGHGGDPAVELESKKYMVSTNFVNSEDTTLPGSDFTYYRASLINNPTVAIENQNTISYGLSVDITTTIPANTIVYGANASGIVYYSNSTHVKINDIIGTFANGESISDGNTTNGTINIIKNTDVTTLSGDVLHYSVYENGVDRSLNTSEDIKFILNLESS